ncbi:hypothetical protein ACNOYE_04055 [Nannocystaceae bacterium ST9]
MAAPDRTFLGPNNTIAMRVSPGVVVQVFTGKVSREHLDASLHMLDHPIVGVPYVQLCRVSPTSVKELPDDEFRARAAESLKARAGKLVGFAYVVAGEGFLASMARAVITGINVVLRPTHPEKVFSEPLAAANWLATHLPEGAFVPEQIVRDVDELVALTH